MKWKGKVYKRKVRPLSERFWERVKITADIRRCWEWTGARHGFGYGTIYYLGKYHPAHRISWYLASGNFPDDSLVLHKCDNAACVNPNHLYLGTHRDNARDMCLRNRQNNALGSKHGQSTLTEEIVLDIRQRYISGECQRSIARIYGIDQSNVSYIVRRKTWRHI